MFGSPCCFFKVNRVSMINIYKKIHKHFFGIYKACDQKFWHGCGSYLIDGKKYEYQKSLIKKQELLFKLAKKNKSILEIGVYMGHSILIMLASNPNLKIVGIDSDDRFSPKAINYLKKKFPKSKVNFILGDSIENLKKINRKFDLYHIDGDHKPKKIYNEILECIRINKAKRIKILFDDIDTMQKVERAILKCFKVKKFIKPNMKYRNLYIEFDTDSRSINKFKNYYYFFLILDFPENILLPYIKKTLRFIVMLFLGKRLSNYLGKFLIKNFSIKILRILGKKLKNI